MDITRFDGEYRWLSNFWPVLVRFDGTVYPSVENAYQAAKMAPSRRAYYVACTPGQAKHHSRQGDVRSDWNDVRVAVMTNLIEQKFRPRSILAGALIATGDVALIEGNTWSDTFWGVCKGVGNNTLGKILMARRSDLRGWGLFDADYLPTLDDRKMQSSEGGGDGPKAG